MHGAGRGRKQEADLRRRGQCLSFPFAERGSCVSPRACAGHVLRALEPRKSMVHNQRRPLGCKGGNQAAKAGFGHTKGQDVWLHFLSGHPILCYPLSLRGAVPEPRSDLSPVRRWLGSQCVTCSREAKRKVLPDLRPEAGAALSLHCAQDLPGTAVNPAPAHTCVSSHTHLSSNASNRTNSH